MSADKGTIKYKLFNKLKDFHNDKDFVVGIMSNVKHDVDMETMISYIDKGEDVTIENLILLSLHLNKARNK